MSTQIALDIVVQDGVRAEAYRPGTSERLNDGTQPNQQHRRSLTGTVVTGDQRGRTLGFPTANIDIGDEGASLQQGVYAVWVALEGHMLPGVAAFGKPMFDNTLPPLETHIFDFSGDIYDRRITVYLVDFIRECKVFSSLDELVASMNADAGKARGILAADQQVQALRTSGAWAR